MGAERAGSERAEAGALRADEERPAGALGGAQDLLAGLNPAQRAAVVHGDGPLLILAGAGSGKTRVITRRIAWQVAERGAHPGSILAITFTNKAAGEMRARIEALIDARGAWIGTFHAMCARMLRREIELLSMPDDKERGYTRDFTIYDTADRNSLLKDLIQRAGFDATRFRPASVGAWISAEKNRCRRPAGSAGGAGAGPGIEEEMLARVRRDYEVAMRASNALDFDDLLLKVLELFEAQPGVRDAYAQRFRHVLVDEYQDTNRVQYLLMRHLAGLHGNLTVCGDPDQSIYAWRGADVRNILDFERDFPGAAVVRLEQNYRSTQNILDAAQAVIQNNKQRKAKALWSERGAGEKLSLTECGDEDDEAREVVLTIRSLVARGARCDQIAIFYRVNFMQRALERALRLASIPYQIVAGTEFYQRREIKDLIAYLRLAVNPSDDEAFRRAVQVPQRGIGDKSLEQLEQWALDRRLTLLRACRSSEARAAIRGRAKAGLEAFAALMDRLAPLAPAPALLALDVVLEETHYLQHLQRSADAEAVDREANVEELRTHAETYDRTQPEGGLRGFLQDIALVSDVDGFEEGQPKVTLMTLHAAKGLEFPYVFIAGLEEMLLPHARAIDEGWDERGDNAGIEEERRLFYVGLTRAQERLFLTHARVRRHFGSEQYGKPSRFLDEIPPNLIEGWGPEGGEASVLGEYAPEPKAGPKLSQGDLVEHDHFGRGRIEQLAGSGANARATVRFEHAGSKQLLLQYANLRVVGRGERR
jgi:DNA helicase-2/ATP-dependent DNA helicase PcrA